MDKTGHHQGMYPYHLQRVQNLLSENYAESKEFCQRINDNRRILLNILFTDGATSTRDGINNPSDEDPHGTIGTNFRSDFSVNVLYDMIDGYTI